jgi:hypothetical protein
MRTVHHELPARHRPGVTTQNRSHSDADKSAPLTYRERCRVALGALGILERKHRLRLTQIQQERAALLANLESARAQ